MGDLITQLSMDNIETQQRPEEEMEILKLISNKISSQSHINKDEPENNLQFPTMSEISNTGIMNDIKHLVIITVLFVIFSSSMFDSLIVKILPSSNKWYFLLIIKIFLLISIYFVLRNLSILNK